MTDKETRLFSVFDNQIGTCKRWVSSSKDIGISREMKSHCKNQVQSLAQIQRTQGQVSYPNMHSVGIPRGECLLFTMLPYDSGIHIYMYSILILYHNADINLRGEIIEEDRPSGVDSEHRQPGKTINVNGQKKKRDEKHRRKLVMKHNKATVT